VSPTDGSFEETNVNVRARGALSRILTGNGGPMAERVRT
jgi:hypothetical protein